MFYNLSIPFDREGAKARLEKLIKEGAYIEIRKRQVRRTLPQNSYLHLLLAYFAAQVGETMEYVKRIYYKAHCNPDLYVRVQRDKVFGNEVKFLRSSAELTVDEMSLSIERFKNWSSAEVGIYLPDATNGSELARMQQEVDRYNKYL